MVGKKVYKIFSALVSSQEQESYDPETWHFPHPRRTVAIKSDNTVLACLHSAGNSVLVRRKCRMMPPLWKGAWPFLTKLNMH